MPMRDILRRIIVASVYKPAGRNIYRIEFKDQHGKTKKISSCTDRRSAEALAQKLEEDADRIRVGLPPKYPEYTAVYLGLVPLASACIPSWEEAQEKYLAELERQ